MSFWSEFKALLAKHGVGLPPHLEQQMANLPVPVPKPAPAPSVTGAYDTPDSNGFVKLTGLTGVAGWENNRYQVQEVTKTLTGDQYNKALANLTHANGEWIIAKFIAVGYEIAEVNGQWPFPSPATSIPNTLSFPGDSAKNAQHPQTHLFYDLTTVDGVVAWLKVTEPAKS